MTGARLVVWDDEVCWRVHEATLALLEETGVEFRHEGARYLLAGAGARVGEVRVDAEALGVSEIDAVGPGGSYADRPHAREHGKEFWSPSLFERALFAHWQAQGATTLKERVHEQAEALRAAPPILTLDDDVRQALEGAVAGARGGR